MKITRLSYKHRHDYDLWIKLINPKCIQISYACDTYTLNYDFIDILS